MKNVIIIPLVIFMSVSVWAQEVDQTRDVTLTILNKRGRPVKNIFVQSIASGNSGKTDRKGMFIFKNMTDNDTITMIMLSHGETHIPVTGMDSLVVVLRAAGLYSYINSEGQGVVIEKDRAKDDVLLDAELLLKRRPNSNSLFDLLQGQVAGLYMANTPSTGNSSGELTQGGSTVNIRGPSSFVSNNEPLVVLDGIAVGTFSEANTIVNVRNLKTVRVLKTASEWGVRGSNGVILLTTK